MRFDVMFVYGGDHPVNLYPGLVGSAGGTASLFFSTDTVDKIVPL